VTYALVPASWGRGHATEGAAAALAFGFLDGGLSEVVGVAREANLASLRVMEKLGMSFVGTRFCYGAELVEYELTAAARGSGAVAAPL